MSKCRVYYGWKWNESASVRLMVGSVWQRFEPLREVIVKTVYIPASWSIMLSTEPVKE